jgi:hypothetical protein
MYPGTLIRFQEKKSVLTSVITQYGHSIKMNQPTKQCLTIKHLIILVIFCVSR